jgi:hypothetical protein
MPSSPWVNGACRQKKVDSLTANRQQARDQPQQGRRRRAERDRGLRRQAPHLGGVGADVAAHAEKHRVAERQQSAEPDQQVERAGEQRHAQHVHQEDRIDEGRRHGKERHHDGERDRCRALRLAEGRANRGRRRVSHR